MWPSRRFPRLFIISQIRSALFAKSSSYGISITKMYVPTRFACVFEFVRRLSPFSRVLAFCLFVFLFASVYSLFQIRLRAPPILLLRTLFCYLTCFTSVFSLCPSPHALLAARSFQFWIFSSLPPKRPMKTFIWFLI